MSNDKMRREIEDLRDQMDKIASTYKTEEGQPHTIGAESGSQNEPATDGNIPTRDSGRSVETGSRSADGSYILPPAGRIMPGAVIMMIALAVLFIGRDFLVPIAVAVLIANLLNALVAAFGRIKIGHSTLPGWLAWTLALAALLLVDALFYWILISQSEALIEAVPVYEANFTRLFEKFSTLIGIEAMPSSAKLMESLNVGALLSWLGGSVGSMFAEVVLVVLYTGFLLAEQRHFPAKVTSLLSDAETAAKARLLMNQISKQVQTYVWMKTVVSLLTGFISYVVLRFVGVDFAAVWGILIFLLNFIPNIGSALGVVFPALLALVQFETLTPFVMVVLGLGSTQFIIGNLVEPALMGSSLNLSSFVIILSLTFWGMIWGIAGMVLCVPIMVIIAIICSNFKRLQWIAVLLSSDGMIRAPEQES